MTQKDLSFFIPFFNEEKHLQSTVEIILRAAKSSLNQFEIILVNDGSSDNSLKIAQKLIEEHGEQIRLISFEQNYGFGKAYFEGFFQSRYDHAMYLCADGDVTENELLTELKYWNGQSSLIQHCTNSHERIYYRALLSKIYTKLVSIISGKSFEYFNGFNIVPTKNKKNIKPIDFGFSMQTYLLFKTVDFKNIQVFGMICRYNDEESKSISVVNVIRTFRFILFLIQWRMSELGNINSIN